MDTQFTLFNKKLPFIYRGVVPGLINLLSCTALAIAWESPMKGVFSLLQFVYPGLLFGFALSIDTKGSLKAWGFIFSVGVIFSTASLVYVRSLFADSGSYPEFWLSCTLPSIISLILYKFLIDGKLLLTSALVTFVPVSIIISLMPAIASALEMIKGIGEIFAGLIFGVTIFLWEVSFVIACYKFTRHDIRE